MTKKQLSDLVKIIFPETREWAFREEDKNKFPRALYWGYVRGGTRASGKTYAKNEMVQISIFSLSPNEPKVDDIEELLVENGLSPDILIEFNETDKVFHFYMGINCERG